jgi:phosphomannomutase
VISKNKISIDDNFAPDLILEKIQAKYKRNPINTIDGVKIEFDDEWVHLRKSNTEPIIRIYAESKSATLADNLAERIMKDIGELLKSNGK